MSPHKRYDTVATAQTAEQRAPEPDVRMPPLRIGVYAVGCPVCGATAGAWCRARLTLPYDVPLSHAHDRRIGEAAKARLI